MVFSSLVCFISLNWLTLTFNYIGHSSYQPLFEEIAPPFLQQLLRLLNIFGYNAVQLLYIVYEAIFMLRLSDAVPFGHEQHTLLPRAMAVVSVHALYGLPIHIFTA